MKKRQKDKILKRAGKKLHLDLKLTPLEKNYFSKNTESRISRELNNFRNEEADKGTIYDSGYINRMVNRINQIVSIENLTGVKGAGR